MCSTARAIPSFPREWESSTIATNLLLVARPSAGQRLDYFFDSNGSPLGSVLDYVLGEHSHTAGATLLNWSLGLEQKLPGSIYLKAEFLQRNGAHGLVYNTPNGLPGGNFILQNTRKDRYHSFQVNLRRAFRHRYTVFGSYTRSSSRSNQVLDFNVDSPDPQPASCWSLFLGCTQPLSLLGSGALLKVAHHP